MYARVEKPKENKSRAVANSVGQKKSNVKHDFGFVDNRQEAVSQRKLQQVLQMKWEEEDEARAQDKLMPIHNKVIEVPTWNVLDQQAWAGLDNRSLVVQWGKNKFRDVLQAIDATKVVNRAVQILEGEVTMRPAPVAFSTESAVNADPMSGELILLDSHHTVNAARILRGDKTIPVIHDAKPDLKGNGTNSEIAESRAAITKNKNIAKKYNQSERGWAAYEEAYREIMKKNPDGNGPMKHRREKGG